MENLSYIDLMLTNKPLYFQTTKVIETSLSDFHRLTITILKSTFRKQEPNIFDYRNAIGKSQNHRSVLRILQEGYSDNKFSFDLISDSDIQNVINTIDSSKAYQKGNIPPQIIKINVDICSMTLVYDINKCINNSLWYK